MEGHLLCNGVFCLGSLFHAATQSLHRGRPGQNMKDHPLSHGARQADWWMGWGKTGREIQKTIWSMRDRSKRGGWGAVLRGKTGSDLCIWWVKRAVINPAEWSVRVVFVCLIVWRLCPCVRRQVRQDPDRKRQPEDTSAQDNLRCSGDPHKWGPDDILSVSELERLKRNSHSTGLKFNPRGQRLEREKLEWKHGEQLRQVGAVRTTSRRRLCSQEEADTLSTGGTEMGGLKKCRKHNGSNQRGFQKQIQIKKEKTKVLRGL